MATTTKKRRQASGVRRQEETPYGVTIPRSIEPHAVPIPKQTQCQAWVQVGQLDSGVQAGRWVYGVEAEHLGSGKRLLVPCALEPMQTWGKRCETRDEAFEDATAELIEWGDEETWPPAAIAAIHAFAREKPWARGKLPPGATSTTTPGGIAVNDPEAIGVRRQASGAGPQPRETAAADRQLAEHWKLTVDPEFKAAQRPLSQDERERLKESLKKYGCRDPIVVWESWDGSVNGGKELVRYVIDGHNRFEICEELHLPFAIIKVRLPDRAAVLDWIRANQLARRNLSPEERDALLAREYRAEVSRRKENAKCKTENAKRKMDAQAEAGAQHEPGAVVSGNGQRAVADNGPKKKAAQVVAEKHGVSPATVKRAAQRVRERETGVSRKAAKPASILTPRGTKELSDAVRRLACDELSSDQDVDTRRYLETMLDDEQLDAAKTMIAVSDRIRLACQRIQGAAAAFIRGKRRRPAKAKRRPR